MDKPFKMTRIIQSLLIMLRFCKRCGTNNDDGVSSGAVDKPNDDAGAVDCGARLLPLYQDIYLQKKSKVS